MQVPSKRMNCCLDTIRRISVTHRFQSLSFEANRNASAKCTPSNYSRSLHSDFQVLKGFPCRLQGNFSQRKWRQSFTLVHSRDTIGISSEFLQYNSTTIVGLRA
jgi:hypothetical protein